MLRWKRRGHQSGAGKKRLIAADTPQFSDMTREEYFAQLDAMTDQVRKEMARMQGVALNRRGCYRSLRAVRHLLQRHHQTGFQLYR